ncbi:hypothetical protein V6N11_004641 [Hibiscus sabdariffa]|uniref:Uncharacterized protein n=1 Tax=Hibiscus sabdariffa TaxID=183260 RepID=A0ABR2SGT7_9ROSI
MNLWCVRPPLSSSSPHDLNPSLQSSFAGHRESEISEEQYKFSLAPPSVACTTTTIGTLIEVRLNRSTILLFPCTSVPLQSSSLGVSYPSLHPPLVDHHEREP